MNATTPSTPLPDVKRTDVAFAKIGPRTALILISKVYSVGSRIGERTVFASSFDPAGEVDLTIADDLVIALAIEKEGLPLPASKRLLLNDWRAHREKSDKAFRPSWVYPYKVEKEAAGILAIRETSTPATR